MGFVTNRDQVESGIQRRDSQTAWRDSQRRDSQTAWDLTFSGDDGVLTTDHTDGKGMSKGRPGLAAISAKPADGVWVSNGADSGVKIRHYSPTRLRRTKS